MREGGATGMGAKMGQVEGAEGGWGHTHCVIFIGNKGERSRGKGNSRDSSGKKYQKRASCRGGRTLHAKKKGLRNSEL